MVKPMSIWSFVMVTFIGYIDYTYKEFLTCNKTIFGNALSIIHIWPWERFKMTDQLIADGQNAQNMNTATKFSFSSNTSTWKFETYIIVDKYWKYSEKLYAWLQCSFTTRTRAFYDVNV